MRTNDTTFDIGPAVQAIPIDDSAAGLTLPHADLLWHGAFKRAGPDLSLTGPDGQRYVVPDYFKREVAADLLSPDGAMIEGRVVELLAGPRAADQYAQAPAPAPSAQLIGKIEKVSGATTVVRNGVAVAVNVGDLVYKGDVLQTGGNSQLSVSFSDGTALSLSANSRMAMTEFIYDPNSTSNSGVMSLLQGGFAFISGQVAHTGGLTFQTPVATMGIRGTAGGCACASQTQCQYFAARNVDGSVSVYQLVPGVGSVLPLLVDIGTLIQIAPNVPPVFLPAANLSPVIGNMMNELRNDYPQIIQNLIAPQRTDVTTDPLRASTAIVGSSNTVAVQLPDNDPNAVTPAAGAVGPVNNLPATPVFVTITLIAEPPSPIQPPPEPTLTVANPIGNQGSPEDAVWNFPIPADVFSDPSVGFVVTLANGDPLETVGLSFDPATRTISGTPPADFNGPIVISVVASGGTVIDSFILNVGAVNDAPIATAAAASLAPILEDTNDPTVPAPGGEMVVDVLGGIFSDATDQVAGGSFANAFAGIAVVGNAATAAQGTWEYFGGAEWIEIPADVSGSNALLLSATTLIRFVPAEDFNGEAPGLTVHLIDDSAGPVTSGQVVNLSATGTGGGTPYSAATVAVGQTVVPVNDGPVAVDDPNIASTAQGVPVDIDVLANDTDDDGDTLSIFGVPTALNGTVAVNDDGTLRYTPNPGHSGPDTITYVVTDGELTDEGQATVNVVAGVTIVGTAGADLIDDSNTPPGQPLPTIGHDTISALGGDDIVHGGAGNDNIDGGTGNDSLFGEAGNDTLFGGNGVDSIFGGDGDDVIVTVGLFDTNDVFSGGAGTDTIAPLLSTVQLTLSGFNALSSSIEVWQGNGLAVVGTNAANTFDFSGLQAITGAGISNINGAGGDDTIIGSQFNDVLLGGAGNDSLNGGAGNDQLTGGLGDDMLAGGAGANTFHFRELLAGNANFGNDQILLFNVSSDVMTFDDAIFADAVTALASAADDGLGNTVITADAGNTVTLQAVAAASLQLGNFNIV
jgi:Ca2+-binding RTX toxin-like protein